MSFPPYFWLRSSGGVGMVKRSSTSSRRSVLGAPGGGLVSAGASSRPCDAVPTPTGTTHLTPTIHWTHGLLLTDSNRANTRAGRPAGELLPPARVTGLRNPASQRSNSCYPSARRGSLVAALAAAAAESRDSALEAFHRDIFADSTRASRDSNFRTW